MKPGFGGGVDANVSITTYAVAAVATNRPTSLPVGLASSNSTHSAADGPEGEAEHRFGERLSPDEPATGDVLE